MNQKEIILQLRKNINKNISMIGIIENYGIENNFKIGDSILVTVKTDHLWCYLTSENKDELNQILKKFKFQTLYFASLEDWMLSVISKHREFEWELKTERLILPKTAELKNLDQNKPDSSNENKNDLETEFKLRRLKPDDTNFIFAHSHYQQFTSKAYIKERIKADCSAGIIIDEKLAAWGLTHDDGALGFIHVREDFRKRGFARLIMQKLISDKRKNKKDVFLNVEPNNLKAKKLFNSFGFEFDRMISWIKLKEK